MSAQHLAAYTTSTGEAFQFWVLGTIAVIGALCTVFMKKAVHSALCLAGTMIVLAVFYLANGAYFLGIVQIVVYTGAIMMLFLFVVMLVGVTAADSLKETSRASAGWPSVWRRLRCPAVRRHRQRRPDGVQRHRPGERQRQRGGAWRPSSSPSTSSPSRSPARC